nr:hypothetical protein Iba_chr14aCG25130 [Ipomoea batatas]
MNAIKLPTNFGAGLAGPLPGLALSSAFTVSVTNGLLSPLLIVGVTSKRCSTRLSISFPRSFLTVTYCGCCVMLIPAYFGTPI